MSGLDIAQTIAEQLPETRAVVVTNLDSRSLSRYDLSAGFVPSLSSVRRDANMPLKLLELCRETVSVPGLVFATIDVEPSTTAVGENSSFAQKAVFFGMLGIFGGMLITATIALAPVGVPIILIGIAVTAIGLIGRLGREVWRRASARRPRGKGNLKQESRLR